MDAAESLALLLRLGGHVTRVAHDGPTALQLAEAEPPEVAFLDIGMPGMDGYEVARRLRAEHRDLKVVALTGYGLESDRARVRAAGFDEHLVKPIDLDAVEALIARLV